MYTKVCTSGALLEVLRSWGEGLFISGKQGEMPNILGVLLC